MKAAYLAALAAAVVTLPAYGCVPELPGGGRILEAGRYTVTYRAVPEKIPVGQHFSLEIAVCANAGGRHRADRLMFHMPGRWEIIFELRAAGRTDRVTQSEVIE